jgi:P-type Cu2+ transporter
MEVEQLTNVVGKGMWAKVGQDMYFVGSRSFILENKISMPTATKENTFENGNSFVFFANTFQVLGFFEIGDELQADVSQHILDLQNAGIVLHILSGDSQAAVEKVAHKLGILNWIGDTLPNDKALYISELQRSGRRVGMVGDGINDTVAFTQADVSFAMAHGADIAMEVADVTILGNDLSRLLKSIHLSKNTVKTINQNLFWAFIYNILSLPVAAGVLWPSFGFLMQPMWASAAMALSSLSVVGNSLFLKVKKI